MPSLFTVDEGSTVTFITLPSYFALTVLDNSIPPDDLSSKTSLVSFVLSVAPPPAVFFISTVYVTLLFFSTSTGLLFLVVLLLFALLAIGLPFTAEIYLFIVAL